MLQIELPYYLTAPCRTSHQRSIPHAAAVADPYLDVKNPKDRFAPAMYRELQDSVAKSADPLRRPLQGTFDRHPGQ